MIRITADGSKTLFSQLYGQTFHSDKGAVTESRHVFLEASGVAEKIRQGQEVSVLEVGFGTGLNFFLTADAALQAGVSLFYTTLEKDLLEAELIQNLAFDQLLQNNQVIQSYLAFRRNLTDTTGQQVFSYQSISLNLLLGEATQQVLIDNTYHAIYQDAFSPDANPELWTPRFLASLYQAMKPAGRLTTYSVKGDVRRTLQAAGFLVEKRPGPPGGKREMLIAVKPEKGIAPL